MLRWTLALIATAAVTGCVEDVVTEPAARVGPALDCPPPKVLVCHVPPGNPEAAHELCVGEAAVRAHVEHHGDTVGACARVCQPFGEACAVDDDCCESMCEEGLCISRT